MLDKVSELAASDAPTVTAVVKAYLVSATNSSEPADWEAYLDGKRRFAREDLARQLRENIRKASSVSYSVEEGKVDFGPYETVLPVGASLKSHAAVPDNEIRRSLVGGYKRTIYEGFRFDSQQEKWLADALDSDDAVLEWMKVPEGKLVIRTPAGRYLPDLIALTGETMYLLEVKDSKSVEEKNTAVVEKARRAGQWAKTLTAHGKQAWKYRLLRHDRVKQGDTLEGMLAAAVSLDEFIA